MEGTIEALLRRLVRGDGDDPFDVVRWLGGSVQGAPGNGHMNLPPLPTVEFPLSDLAHGLLSQWAKGTSLQKWALTVLMADAIQFEEAESPEEEVLLDSLWRASAGEPVTDEALALSRRLNG